MVTTKDGDVLIHRKTWDILKNDENYRELTSYIEDLELHYQSMSDEGRVSLTDYDRSRKRHV
jgi:hypothetical protein